VANGRIQIQIDIEIKIAINPKFVRRRVRCSQCWVFHDCCVIEVGRFSLTKTRIKQKPKKTKQKNKMTSHGMAANKDAYNNIASDDMSTMFGNDRGSMDLTQRTAMGGDAMPSARMQSSEWIGEDHVRTPIIEDRGTDTGAPARIERKTTPPSSFKAEWQRARLARLPNTQALAAHPTVRALLDQQFAAADTQTEEEQMTQLGTVIGQINAQVQLQRVKQQQQALALAQTQAQQATTVTKQAQIPNNEGGIPMWWIAAGVAGIVAVALVLYAWSTGLFHAKAASAVPSSTAAPMLPYSAMATRGSALGEDDLAFMSSSIPPASAFETLASLSGPPRQR
jgi:hypothetical protein